MLYCPITGNIKEICFQLSGLTTTTNYNKLLVYNKPTILKNVNKYILSDCSSSQYKQKTVKMSITIL